MHKVNKAVSVMLISTLAVLTGCTAKEISTSSSEVASKESSSNTQEKTKVKLWSHLGDMKDKMTELVDKYNKTNKDGIEIELNVVADKYNDVLNMAFTSGEGPDIFTVGGPSLTLKIAQTKWGEPLNKYVTPEFKSKFRDGVWIENNNVVGGQIYTIPDQAATIRMIYNKKLFKDAGLDPEKPPTTFAEVREYAKKIKAASGGKASGFGLPMGDVYFTDVILFNGMGMNAVGSMRGFDYKAGKFDFSVYKPILQLMEDMKKDGSMLEGELLLKRDQGTAKFAEGSIGIMGAASWDPAILAGYKMDFEMGVAEFPTIDGAAKGKAFVQMGSGYAMSSKTKDKDKTWKVMEWIYSPEFMGEMVKKAGWISLVKEIADNPKYKSDIKYLEHFAFKANDAIWPPVVPGLKIQGDNQQTVFIQVITGAKKADEALADLTKRYNEAFDKALAEGTFKKEDFVKPDFDPLKLK
ncbi:ABC transporter substrate-binding protein [Paenibacillus silviterrae]|uniref:ABC transporter substrate-binding protein n=1 Tax=Paenibacillus silviterrae TaxID=3242194 RepID=UPI00254324C9|nr:extracellular solute-binding protein [Paenibacillus chinjuensis]